MLLDQVSRRYGMAPSEYLERSPGRLAFDFAIAQAGSKDEHQRLQGVVNTAGDGWGIGRIMGLLHYLARRD